MYYFKTKIGTLWIRRRKDGFYELGIGNRAIGTYHADLAAADDIYLRAAGWIDWSKLKGESMPRDLSEWNFTPNDVLP